MKARFQALCLGAAALSLALGFAFPRPFTAPLPAGAAPEDPKLGKEAYRLASEFEKAFPNRDAGIHSVEAADWVGRRLLELGYAKNQVGFQDFKVNVNGVARPGRNVFAVSPGEGLDKVHDLLRQGGKDVVVLSAHLDTPFLSPGADDNASGVGLLLALAAKYRALPHKKTLVFLADDFEERGIVGSAQFLRDFHFAHRILAGLNFDMVGYAAYKAAAFQIDGEGRGATGRGYLSMAVQAAREAGLPPRFNAYDPARKWLSPLASWLMRAGGHCAASQGPLLAGGVDALSLGGAYMINGPLGPGTNPNHHTRWDSLDTLSPETFGRFGRAAERLLAMLESVEKLPARGWAYLPYGEGTTGWGFEPALLLGFLPVFAGAFAAARRLRRSSFAAQDLARFGSAAAAVGLFLGLAWFSVDWLLLRPAGADYLWIEGLMNRPRLELFLLPLAAAWAYARWQRRRLASSFDAEGLRAWALIALGLYSLAALVLNPYYAALVLVPANLWLWARPGGSWPRKALSLAFIALPWAIPVAAWMLLRGDTPLSAFWSWEVRSLHHLPPAQAFLELGLLPSALALAWAVLDRPVRGPVAAAHPPELVPLSHG